MRAWILLVLVGGVARAAPSAYQCKPGTTKRGVGCVCPKGYRDHLDGDNTAICYARSPGLPQPTKPAAKPKYTHTSLKVTATPIVLAARPLPPLAPSLARGNDAYKAAWASITARKRAGLDALAQLATTKEEAVRRAAIADLPRVYVELGAPERAVAALQRLPEAAAILDGLGKLYLATPNADAALVIYRGLATTYPTHPDRCAWLEAAGRASAASGTTTIADKTSAALAVATEATRIKTCRDGAATLVGELARWTHAQGALDSAEVLYRLYLARFPELPAGPEHAYYLAELLWTRAEALKTPVAWEAAAVAFTDAARTGKLSAALTKDSAYAAVLGWKTALDKPISTSVDARDTTPKPIPARDTRMLASFELYLTHADPTDDDLPAIKFLKANIYRRANRLDEVLPMLRDIIKQHPGSDVAVHAVELALDTLNRLQRFDEMLAFVDDRLADAGFLANKDRLRDMLIGIKRGALARRAMVLADEGTPAKAVECGETFIKQYNADPLASDNDMALYNAMLCFEKGEDWTRALKVFAVFERYHAKSSYAPKAKEMAAIARKKLGK